MRYPPQGSRSFAGSLAVHYGPDYGDWANQEVFLAVQIETAQAAERVEEILAVEGVDGCWIGPMDLARSMGVRRARQPTKMPFSACWTPVTRPGKSRFLYTQRGDRPPSNRAGFRFVCSRRRWTDRHWGAGGSTPSRPAETSWQEHLDVGCFTLIPYRSFLMSSSKVVITDFGDPTTASKPASPRLRPRHQPVRLQTRVPGADPVTDADALIVQWATINRKVIEI
jgi:hypothetical protein